MTLLDLTDAHWLCNGSFNPLLNKEQLINSMVVHSKMTTEEANEEYNRRKEIEEKYKPKEKTNLSLACYMATNGGKGNVKCNDFTDLRKAVNLVGQFNNFYPSKVNSTLFNTFGKLKKFYGLNNPNSGVLDAFEYYFEGDAIEVVSTTFTKNKNVNFIYFEDGVWKLVKIDDIKHWFETKQAVIENNTDASSVTFKSESSDWGTEYLLRMWWD